MNPPVTYGSELAAARRNLLALRDTHDHAATVASGLAWLGVYRTLYRHLVVLLGTQDNPLAAALATVTSRLTDAIHAATDGDTRPARPGDVPPALMQATDHLSVAADILFSHIGPDGSARSPAAIAVLEQVGRDHHVAAIADLIDIATQESDGPHRLTITEPASITDPGGQLRTLQTLAKEATRHHPNGDTYLTGLRPALDVSAPTWPAVTDHAGFREALLAARTWLAQHLTTGLTGQQLRQSFGAGLALSNELGFLAQHNHDEITTTLRARHHTSTWRTAYLNTENITSLDNHDQPAGLTALLNAEHWLRTQLRSNGAWRDDALPQAAVPDAALWRDTTAELARSLPDIATMLHHSVRVSTDRRRLHTLDTLDTSTTVISEPTWTLATAQTPAIARLISAAHDIRPAAVLLNNVLGVTPHTGVHETGRNPLRLPHPEQPPPSPDTSGPTAQMIRQLTNTHPATPTPLPPATATLADRARYMTRRKSEKTKIPVPLAHRVVAEVQALADTIDRLQSEIDHLRTTAVWGAVDQTLHPGDPADDHFLPDGQPAESELPDLDLP
jgi:hypothetical protein